MEKNNKFNTHSRNQVIKSSSCFKVLIVNFYPIVQHGLEDLINQQKDFTVCGKGDNNTTMLKAIEENQPDIVIMGLSYVNCTGISLIKEITQLFSDIRIMVFSICDESIFAGRCLEAGACGYVEMTEPVEKIICAMRRILKGAVYVSERVQDRLLCKFIPNPSGTAALPVESLSNRELEVFQFMGQGLKAQEIADELNLSVKTISSHVERIKRKMNLENTREVLLHAAQLIADPGQKRVNREGKTTTEKSLNALY